MVSANRFSGPLPASITNASDLTTLDVVVNSITGPIPNNLLTGTIPESIGELSKLGKLHLDGNNISGAIPASISNMTRLLDLRLENNMLQARLPIALFNVSTLQALYLNDNSLTGVIPEQIVGLLGQCTFLYLVLFQSVGNLRLCGGIQELHLPACPLKVSRDKEKTFSSRTILLIVLLPLGSFLVFFALICYCRRNSKKLNNPVPVLQGNQYLDVSYKDLATNEFSPNNFLGEGKYGSVYKGLLRLPKQSVEHIVAVKVLKVEVRGANKSFLAESGTLRNIRHRNLIKIVTACSSTDFKGNDFKALVFEFMNNGSLEDWLHTSPYYQGSNRNLSLLHRLNISIDVAMGLDYLHHYTHECVIHCDIKPSNILLDENFVARIGDFGLARFCLAATTSDINHAQISSTGVRGTVGYVPPEYGTGAEVSAKGDVYSYGILLLELFSGKRPTESSILMGNGNNLHDYVRKALLQRVTDIADPRIVLVQEELGLNVNQSYSRATVEVCLASIFEVGISCSQETPRKRIDISVAAKQLQIARDKLLQCIQ